MHGSESPRADYSSYHCWVFLTWKAKYNEPMGKPSVYTTFEMSALWEANTKGQPVGQTSKLKGSQSINRSVNFVFWLLTAMFLIFIPRKHVNNFVQSFLLNEQDFIKKKKKWDELSAVHPEGPHSNFCVSTSYSVWTKLNCLLTSNNSRFKCLDMSLYQS